MFLDEMRREIQFWGVCNEKLEYQLAPAMLKVTENPTQNSLHDKGD